MRAARTVIVVLATVIATVSARGQTDTSRCTASALAVLPVSYDQVSRPIVPATLDGKDERLIVDTGGIFSMLAWRTVRDLRLNEHYLNTKTIYMLNGSSAKYDVKVGELGLGPMSVPWSSFVVMPADWTLTDADGTIAPDLFSKYDVEFDFAGNRMRLFSRGGCAGPPTDLKSRFVALPMYSDEHALMHVSAKVDGTDVDAVVDTGSGQSVLRLDVADAVLGRPVRGSELVHAGSGTSNGWDVYRVPFHELRFGQVLVKNPDLFIMTDKLALVRQYGALRHYWRPVSVEPPELIIGMSVLRKLHLYVSYRTNTLYVAAGAA